MTLRIALLAAALALAPLLGAAPAAAQAPAALVLTALRCDAPEVVEVTNVGERPVDLDGWTLSDRDGDLDARLDGPVLAPGAFVRLHPGDGDDRGRDRFLGGPDDAFADGVLPGAEGLAFDAARLRDPSGTTVTSLACFEGAPGLPTRCIGSLDVEPRADGTVRLDWDPVPAGAFDGRVFYDVFRAVNERDFVPLADTTFLGAVPEPDTAFLDRTATPGVTYRYAVVATGDVEPTGTPDEACPAATATANPGDTAAGGALRGDACAPGLRAEALPGGDVRLTWTPADATGWQVQRRTADDTLEPLLRVAGDATSATVTANPGDVLDLVVADAAGDASACEAVTVTAIPSFPAAWSAAVALGLGVAARFAARRP